MLSFVYYEKEQGNKIRGKNMHMVREAFFKAQKRKAAAEVCIAANECGDMLLKMLA